jgi:hypothetical protein
MNKSPFTTSHNLSNLSSYSNCEWPLCDRLNFPRKNS